MSTGGCSLFDRPPERPDRLIHQLAPQRVFFSQYDNVWRAAHATVKYPIAAENQDTGMIETEYVKSIDGFMPPHQQKSAAGVRYKLILIFAKVKADGREGTRVTIEKKIERLRDFFSEPESIESDGLEEKSIFYRMDREIIISEALKKASQIK